MAQCKDCIHYGLCKIYSDFIRNHDCELFVGKADVVPKREVETLAKEVDRLSQVVLYNDSVTEMKVEEAKQEIAREIFEEIDGITDLVAKGLIGELEFYDKIAELKKKYGVYVYGM